MRKGLGPSVWREGAWEAPGAAGVWPALYTGGVGVAWAWGAGVEVEPRRVLAVVIAALGVFLLDRVKLADGAIDPSDARADPVRYAWLDPTRRLWRGVAWGCLVVATLGLAGDRAVVAPAAFAVMAILYAGLPRARGVKRAPGLKPIAVGAGLTLFAAWGVGGGGGGGGGGDAWVVMALLALLITGDAALCDLDEHRRGAPTEPGAWAGRLGVWGVIGVVTLLQAFVALVWQELVAGGPWLWMALLAGSTPMLGWMPRGVRIKDVVDLRWVVALCIDGLSAM